MRNKSMNENENTAQAKAPEKRNICSNKNMYIKPTSIAP